MVIKPSKRSWNDVKSVRKVKQNRLEWRVKRTEPFPGTRC